MGNTLKGYAGYDASTPDFYNPPKHDPMEGFENGRKERVSKLSEREMEVMRIPHEYRDYCADKLVDFYECRQKHFPYVGKCKHEEHVWNNCQFEDYVLRMKEFERERRLNQLANKKLAQEAEELMA